jgi:hypothetical protein
MDVSLHRHIFSNLNSYNKLNSKSIKLDLKLDLVLGFKICQILIPHHFTTMQMKITLSKTAYNSKCFVLLFVASTDLRAANYIGHGKQCDREGYFISRKVVVLIAAVYVCSLVVTGLLVFYFVPRSSSSKLQASDTNLTSSFRVRPQVTLPQQKTPSSNRLPTHIIPSHYRSEAIFLCF